MVYSIRDPDADLYPQIARAVSILRKRFGFSGRVGVKPLKRGRLGQSGYTSSSPMFFDPRLESRTWEVVFGFVVHENLHTLGFFHEENFRSFGGTRCQHGHDALSHRVAEIVLGNDTWENMVFLHKTIGAYTKRLLRQIARVEATIARQRGIKDTLGGCTGLADLTDSRMYRWQQMSSEARKRQTDAMQAGRMRKLRREIPRGWH